MKKANITMSFQARKIGGPKTPTGYYWRDYTGEVPDDALPGGHDINGKATYIGQGFLKEHGLIVGTINPGQSGMRLAHSWKAHYVDYGLKILCSTHWNRFAWENAEKTSLHTKYIGKHLVVGGFENGGKILNIGRAMSQGQLLVGKVLGYQPGNAPLFVVCGTTEEAMASYQILVYYK